ncbi:MAG: hypothetical protein WAO08_19280 [Hyphomicrobiaceae bacterium]
MTGVSNPEAAQSSVPAPILELSLLGSLRVGWAGWAIDLTSKKLAAWPA